MSNDNKEKKPENGPVSAENARLRETYRECERQMKELSERFMKAQNAK